MKKRIWTIIVCMLLITTILPITGTILAGDEGNPEIEDETSNWCVEVVDDEGNTGRYTSIDLDSFGFPHISYCREDNGGYVKYAYWNGAVWIIKTIDVGLDENFGNVLTTSIAIDSKDCPHIVYSKPPDMLKYAHWDGFTWNYSTIYTGQGIYGSVGIALDTNDNPHVSYCNGIGSFLLRYAYWNGTKWINEVVDNRKYSGFHNSISLDSKDCAHIAYTDANHKTVEYAYRDSLTSEWDLETVDMEFFGLPMYPAIDIDSKDCPHIGYYDSGYNNLMYAYKEESSSIWNTETIISNKQVGRSYSLAISDRDYPYLMYQNIDLRDLNLIYWNGTNWVNETIDSEGMVGCCSDIILDSHDIAFISYRDEGAGDLKFAFENKAPDAPSITGPPSGKVGKEFQYVFTALDLNNHDVKYYIDWGDESNSGWIGPFNSSEEITRSHTWDGEGTYTIKSKAKDIFNAESGWATLEVSMPKSRQYIDTPFIRFLEKHLQIFPILRNIIKLKWKMN